MPYTLKEIQDAFEKFDTNPKNGKLSKKELIAILTRPGGGHSFTERWAEEFMHRCGELELHRRLGARRECNRCPYRITLTSAYGFPTFSSARWCSLLCRLSSTRLS